MSNITQNLKLFKWDITNTTDKASRFNIPVSLNGNWDNIDAFAGQIREVIGTGTDTFSTSETYEVGDIVIHNKTLYKCTTVVETAGEFDSDNWTEISIKDLIDELTDDKVDKEQGKGLSTNDYSTSEKEKLAGVETGAEVNVIETVKVNGTSLTPSNKTVDVPVPTKTSDLNNDSGFIDKDVNNLTNYYDKNAVDTKISAVYKYKGTVSTYADLPVSDLTVGDVYNVETADSTHGIKAGDNVSWNGTVWDVLAGTVDLSGKEDKSNKVTEIDENSTDTQYPSAKLLYDQLAEKQEQIETNATNIANLETTSKDLSTRVVALERKTGKVYGIKRKITDNSSTIWTRIEDAVGLIANARIATSGEIVNNFNEIYPWSEIKTCNVDNNGNITNYIDEPGFAFDGSNGEVMTRIPTFWFKREKMYDDDENLWEYIYIADYPKEGFTRVDEFLIARYNLSADSSNKAHSISGVAPKYSATRANFRTYARNLSTDYCLMDWRAFILQILYLVEYADYNSQNKLGQGIVAYSTATAIATENSVNRIIVSSVGAGLYVGKTVGIGTVAGNFSVAQDRQITAIEDFSNGEITGKAISFDGTAVNIETGNIILGSAQICGDCDSLGMESGCLINNGYHSMIYRGVENIFGNIWQHVDGINIKDYQAYVCYDPTQYANDVFDSPYEQLGYLNSDTNDSYIKEFGYDENNPAIALPVAVGGSSSTYVADNYWCLAGNRIAYLGGSFYSTWAGRFICFAL